MAGDVTSLELVWERARDDAPGSGVWADLKKLRAAADRKDTAEAGRLAPGFAQDVGKLEG